MKKYLPNKSQGFTLVELLVVISIVAILATISVSVFGNAQKNARDGKRISDVDSVSKSLETSKDFTTGNYYNNLSADFPNGLNEPSNSKYYCLYTDTTKETMPTPAPTWAAGCPAVGTVSGADQVIDISGSTGIGTTFSAGTKSWLLCASRENPQSNYCKHSIERGP